MKTADIKPGGRYRVRLSEEQSLIYLGCDVTATVLRAGFHYDVTQRRGSMVRGAPYVTEQKSEHANGVEVQWETQEVASNRRHAKTETVSADRAILGARSVRYAIED